MTRNLIIVFAIFIGTRANSMSIELDENTALGLFEVLNQENFKNKINKIERECENPTNRKLHINDDSNDLNNNQLLSVFYILKCNVNGINKTKTASGFYTIP